jgi:hypothetical protein
LGRETHLAVAASGPTDMPLFYALDLFNTSIVLLAKNGLCRNATQQTSAVCLRGISSTFPLTKITGNLQMLSDHGFQYVNGQRLKFRINVVSPAHPIEQLSEIPAKSVARLGR